MKKRTIIILSCVISAIVIFTAGVLAWAFPLQNKWRSELKKGFKAPAETERYVCNMTETTEKSGGDVIVNTYNAIVNKKSDAVWQYVGNTSSGGYKEGDLTYKYKGDPLSDGKLIEVGKDTEMPLPKYVEYFSFLFNQDDALDFSSAVSGIWKFTIGNVCTYYFTLSHKWFIENYSKSFHMYDEHYYHYSDVRFTIKSNKTDGRILQISCSYDNAVDAHWETYTIYNPINNYFHTDYIKAYSYKKTVSVQFSYPESNTPIETDQQFLFSRSLNNGMVDTALTIPTDEYVLSEASTNPDVQYAIFNNKNFSTLPAVSTLEKDDILAVYSKNCLEVYQLSTLKKLAAMEYHLDVVCVDVDDGQLLVVLRNNGNVSCPWEQNYCFVIYDLSDFSVLNRLKAIDCNPDQNTPSKVYAYLYDNKILYVDDARRICICDITSNTTNITEQFLYDYTAYLDRENGKLLYYDHYLHSKSYDIATAKVEDYTFSNQPSLTLVVENFEFYPTNNYSEIAICNRESGETLSSTPFRRTVDTDEYFAIKLANGKYFCSVIGCLMIIDVKAL